MVAMVGMKHPVDKLVDKLVDILVDVEWEQGPEAARLKDSVLN